MTDRPRVAVFRPDDERITEAVDLLDDLGTEAVPDPMLEVEATGASPRTDADYTVFTSKTGAELIAEAGWTAGESTVCAIGDPTADALDAEGYAVDLIPEEFTSAGLVDTLEGTVEGERVEVARSDHGSAVLLDGLNDAGAYVHETVLYRLTRPDAAGESAEVAAAGDLDAALFTSSLTVEHFLEAAAERGLRDAAVSGLDDAVVAVIGPPTAETAREHGLPVDVVASEADFETLAREAVAATGSER
ncbi:uroporphyrinogen-III synthase [Halorientalis sp. IM1011]|uniref:uroporphyrinogen-III synthase n=1 Tax=Halorientalis sp. IM1011 TaxID=1932360 RepID=UPI00097CC645|nr:uroporphyrinogen-III synthase [Halorientalis sp. IM1011]AQL42844.1 uroporphyrinogen-III synthase [Halorientalis sp. IM1011]